MADNQKSSANDAVDDFCTLLRRRQIEGSLPCAKKTADIMRMVIAKKAHPESEDLIAEVRVVGYKLQAAKPVELAVGNVVRRVLHMIREEAKHEKDKATDEKAPAMADAGASAISHKQQLGLLSQALSKLGRGPSLSNLLEGFDEDAVRAVQLLGQLPGQASGPPQQEHVPAEARDAEIESHSSVKKPRQKAQAQWKGKQEVIDSLNELILELENIKTSITAQGVEHIHANEVILTLGMSDTTFLFLKEASKKREFQVVVAEGAPTFDGHLMAKKLSNAGIQTTLIPDSAVFAMMARAHKVLVGVHAVLANGGVIAPVGMHMVALAAKRHSIPFVVLVGLHKLSPLFPQDTDLTYNDFRSPAHIADHDISAEAFCQQEALTHSADWLATSPSASAASTSGGGTHHNSVGGSAGPGPAFISTGGLSAAMAGAAGGNGSSAFATAGVGLSAALRSASTIGHASHTPLTPMSSVGGQQGASAAGPNASVKYEPLGGNLHLPNPAFDYVPPHLISLFITDNGGHTPSYVYRLITEYYSRDDYMLSKALKIGVQGL